MYCRLDVIIHEALCRSHFSQDIRTRSKRPLSQVEHLDLSALQLGKFKFVYSKIVIFYIGGTAFVPLLEVQVTPR